MNNVKPAVELTAKQKEEEMLRNLVKLYVLCHKSDYRFKVMLKAMTPGITNQQVIMVNKVVKNKCV